MNDPARADAVRALVVRAPGTNCDAETVFALRQAGAAAATVHVNRLLAHPETLDDIRILVFPGGFSYGDDLGAGRLLAHRLKTELGERLAAFRDGGGLILGICNGFQVLLQTGLLVEPDGHGHARATLTLNDSGRYRDAWVRLRLTPGRCAFVREEMAVEMPIAHAEGNFQVADDSVVEELHAAGRIVARYEGGSPNGSVADVAGICDGTGRVFALMPHPERWVLPHHHPQWTRREPVAEGDGLRIFRNAVEHFA